MKYLGLISALVIWAAVAWAAVRIVSINGTRESEEQD